jgi:peptidyl-prolyl cis-trans isomerase C
LTLLNSLNRWYSSGLFVLGLLAFSACKSTSPEAVATVDKTPITLADFKSRLQGTPPAYQQYVTTPEGRRQFLNILIREKVLLAESRKAGLPKEENYRKALNEFKQKRDQELKDYENSLLIEMYLTRLRSKDLAVTDAEVRNYYDQHAADFAKPMEIQASHILVNTEQEAENVLTRLKNGESFETVARAVSMDPPTAARGGKLAPFIKGNLMPEFENAVLPLKEGQVSGVVKSPFGYHVIKKTGQKSLAGQSFEQAKDTIQTRLQREKFDKWVTQAQASMNVKIDEKALAAVSMEPSAAATGGMLQ